MSSDFAKSGEAERGTIVVSRNNWSVHYASSCVTVIGRYRVWYSPARSSVVGRWAKKGSVRVCNGPLLQHPSSQGLLQETGGGGGGGVG